MSEITDALKKNNVELPPNLVKELEGHIKSGKLKKKYVNDVILKVDEAYGKAKIEPGEGVGVLAAQSIGEPGTQMMMRTKHYAGTAMDVTRGLPRLIEIFDARRTPKTPMMSIVLKKDYNTLEKAEKMAHSVRETRIKNVGKNLETNFAKFEISIELDKEGLQRRGLTPTKLKSIIDEKFGKEGKVKFPRITIKSKKKVASALQRLKEEVQKTHLSGIKGVSYVVVQKEDNDYVLYTKGTNLKDVLEIKEVDPKKTYSNDVMEMEKVFGIEAARNMLVFETLATLKDAGLTVDPRHVTLVADTMTSDGIVQAIGRHGISGKKASILARASFEETVKHLLKAAAYGETEKLNGVVENIIVGKVISLGTGVPELILKGQAKTEKSTSKK